MTNSKYSVLESQGDSEKKENSTIESSTFGSYLNTRILQKGAPLLLQICSFSFPLQNVFVQKRSPTQLVLPNGDIAIGILPSGLNEKSLLSTQLYHSHDNNPSEHDTVQSNPNTTEESGDQTELERLNELRNSPIVVYATRATENHTPSELNLWWGIIFLLLVIQACCFGIMLQGSYCIPLANGRHCTRRSIVVTIMYAVLFCTGIDVLIKCFRHDTRYMYATKVTYMVTLPLQLLYTLCTVLDVIVFSSTLGLWYLTSKIHFLTSSHLFCVPT